MVLWDIVPLGLRLPLSLTDALEVLDPCLLIHVVVVGVDARVPSIKPVYKVGCEIDVNETGNVSDEGDVATSQNSSRQQIPVSFLPNVRQLLCMLRYVVIEAQQSVDHAQDLSQMAT